MVQTNMEGRKEVVTGLLCSKRATVVFRCGERAPLGLAGEKNWYCPQGGGKNAEQAVFKDKIIQNLENQRARLADVNEGKLTRVFITYQKKIAAY